MTTVVDELQKLLAGPANLTTDEAVAVAMAIALLKAQAAQPSQAVEPVVYQSRMRPLWGQSLWTEWSNCTKGMHDDYKKTPILNDWEFEARALSVTPQGASPQPSQAGVPDMFWNHDDAEKLYSSVDEFLNDEICNGTPLEVGDTRTIQCAIRLPNFDIRVTSIDEEESEAEYEVIAAINAKGTK